MIQSLHDIGKLDLPYGIPGIVDELESIVRETSQLEFGEKYFSLSSTSDIVELTLTFTEVDSSIESASDASIHTSAPSVYTSVTSIHPSSSCSSGSQDTLILSSLE